MKRRLYVPLWALLACGPLGAGVSPAIAQSVVEIYQRQYYRRQALAKIRENGERIAPQPLQPLKAPLDTIVARFEQPPASIFQGPPPPAVTIRHIQRIPKLARNYFRSRFEGQQWVFAGATSLSPLDTMMTREIRSRLEAHFGKPTQTIVDENPADQIASGDIFQFEYWFVLDQDIPLIVTDVNGPFERGIAVSTTTPHGDILVELRDALLAPILASNRRATFVDYYYDDEVVQWYRTGYDGSDFFVDPVKRPGLNRPVLRPRPD
jgi:hypothetical protein